VDEAKKRIEAELVEARKEVERQTPELAGAIAKSILEGAGPSPSGARR
jgi:F0F1-type ATP synthase membrane subunit b/b'